MAINRSLWCWNISEHIRNCSPDLFQIKCYHFIIMKGITESQSTVNGGQQEKDLLFRKKLTVLMRSRKGIH